MLQVVQMVTAREQTGWLLRPLDVILLGTVSESLTLSCMSSYSHGVVVLLDMLVGKAVTVVIFFPFKFCDIFSFLDLSLI